VFTARYGLGLEIKQSGLRLLGLIGGTDALVLYYFLVSGPLFYHFF